MTANDTRPECKECMQHGIHSLKLGQLCQWKESHEIGTNKWRTNMEQEFSKLRREKIKEHNELRNEYKEIASNLKTWAIANLTGIVVVLIVLVANLIVKVKP
jgi:hypothetical protein